MLEVDLLFDELHFGKYIGYSSLLVATNDVLFFPLELLKTRLQVQGMRAHTTSCPNYGGLISAARSVYRLEGVRGFYKGLGPSLSFVVPAELTYVTVYEASRHQLLGRMAAATATSSNGREGSTGSDGDGSVGAMQRLGCDFVAGGAAELVAGVVWVPADLASQRLQVQGPDRANHLYKNAFDVVRKVVHAQGARGLYVGYVPAIMTHVPTSALLWSLYQQFKRSLVQWKSTALARRRDTGNTHGLPAAPVGSSHTINAVSGFASGCIAAFATNPLDVVRVRMQVQGHSRATLHMGEGGGGGGGSPGQPRPPLSGVGQYHHVRPPPPAGTGHGGTPLYRGVFHALRTIGRQEGVAALWHGSSARSLMFGLGSSFGLLLYDYLKSISKL